VLVTRPNSPTVTPLNAREPMADMLKSPITRPRMVSGAFSCTSACVMLPKDSSRNPAKNSTQVAAGYQRMNENANSEHPVTDRRSAS